MNLLQIPLTMWGDSCSRKLTQERLTEPLKCESPKLVPLPCVTIIMDLMESELL